MPPSLGDSAANRAAAQRAHSAISLFVLVQVPMTWPDLSAPSHLYGAKPAAQPVHSTCTLLSWWQVQGGRNGYPHMASAVLSGECADSLLSLCLDQCRCMEPGITDLMAATLLQPYIPLHSAAQAAH